MEMEQLGEEYLKTAKQLQKRVDMLRKQWEGMTPQQGYVLLQRIECLEQEIHDLISIGYYLKRRH